MGSFWKVQRSVGRIAAPLVLMGLAWSATAVASPQPGPKFFPQKNRVAVRKSTIQSASNVAIVNAASFLPGICPGGVASIFGVGLSTLGLDDPTQNVTQGATTIPLPFQIADITVFVNGVAAPLFSVSYTNDGDDEINIQVPYEAPVGLGAALIDVYSNGALVVEFSADSYTEDPGIFLYYVGQTPYAVALDLNYSIISPSNPAYPGDYIILYTTGLGPLTVDLPDGAGAPSDPLAYTQDPFQALLNGEQSNVPFSGLAPGFVGIDQLNLQIPSDAVPGDLPIQITTQYASSGIANISIGALQ